MGLELGIQFVFRATVQGFGEGLGLGLGIRLVFRVRVQRFGKGLGLGLGNTMAWAEGGVPSLSA